MAVQAQDVKVHLVAPTEPLTPAEQQKAFHLPEGYTIELVASEPEIRKPMNLNFDAAGRLWVSQSIEYPYPVKENRAPMDTLRFLTDTNTDGVPDKMHVFTDGLNIPIGITPIHDGVLSYSIPSIDLFRDVNGDGKADERLPFYGEFGSRDTHGMASSFTWWLDGWIYATHGFANDSTVQGGDGHTIKMNSGNTYRFRPDGSRIEQWTWGQVNPFGLAFDELGNMYSADCHSRPLYMLLRGAYYPSFGKPDDGLGFGPEMITHSHGSTGICGVAWYGATQFPKQHGTIFICNPVTGRINHDRFDTHGSSHTAVELPDFVTCDDPWFRPVDIKLAPDGTLYIADFYNRIIGHYEVPLTHPQRDRERGRIWRISYTGEGKTSAPLPDLTKTDLNTLLDTLGHENIVLRTLATHQVVHRIGEPAVEPLQNVLRKPADGNWAERQRAHSLWVLSRLHRLEEGLIATAAKDPSRLVRTHLARCLSERPEWSPEVVKTVQTLALDADAFVRRAAADAIGRHPSREHVPLLLSMWEQADVADTHLIHVVRMALRDMLKAEGTSDLPETAVNAPQRVRKLADICLGVRTDNSAAFLLNHVGTDLAIDVAQQAKILQSVVRFVSDKELPRALQAAAERRKLDAGAQLAIVRAVQRGLQERGAQASDDIAAWQRDLAAQLLRSKDEGTLKQGLEVAQEFQVRSLAVQVKGIAERSPPLKLRACETLAALDGGLAVPILDGVLRDGSGETPARQRAADLLAGLNSERSRAALLEGLIVAPAPVQLSIARGLAGSTEGGVALLKVLSEGKATPGLLLDQVVAEKLRGAKIPDLGRRIEELTKDLPSDDARLHAMAASRRESFLKSMGDPTRGLAVYTKNCAGCHRLENKGTKVGPDLDGIGLRGLDRILEDTLTPNRNVDQAFRATLLALKDGTTVSGLVQREEGEVLVVINDQAKEVRVPKSDVEDRRQLQLSPMPTNLAEQLPAGEFHDLLAYLLSQKSQPKTESP